MGLFRLAIVAAVGVSLLPSDAGEQEKLIVRAADAARWTFTFCQRNATTCEHAADAWAAFKTKAEFGAKLAYDIAAEKAATFTGDTGALPPRAFERTSSGTSAVATAPVSNTLKKSDKEPAWRGQITVRPPR